MDLTERCVLFYIILMQAKRSNIWTCGWKIYSDCYYILYLYIYVFSWAIIRQWRVFFTVSLTLSNSLRSLVTSTRTFSHVSLVFPRWDPLFDFLSSLYSIVWCALYLFSTAAKSAEKLTPELVIFPATICSLAPSGWF